MLDLIKRLINCETIDEKYDDHILKGNYKSYRECHVKPDLLLIYKVVDDKLVLTRVGTHPNLFD